jgi:hypothetical protein
MALDARAGASRRVAPEGSGQAISTQSGLSSGQIGQQGVRIMFHSIQSRFAGALTGVLLAFCAPGLAKAGPMSFPGAAIVTPQAPIVDVRYYRRYPAVPAIAFGLFGAILGAAIADGDYDNYDYYGYGGPGYSGGWNGAGHRGGHVGGHVGGHAAGNAAGSRRK